MAALAGSPEALGVAPVSPTCLATLDFRNLITKPVVWPPLAEAAERGEGGVSAGSENCLRPVSGEPE